VDEANKAGLNIVLSENSIAETWKMLINYPTIYAISGVCGLTIGDVCSTEQGSKLIKSLVHEICEIAKKDGVKEELFNEEIAMKCIETEVNENYDSPGSILLDINSHKITDTEITCGVLIRNQDRRSSRA